MSLLNQTQMLVGKDHQAKDVLIVKQILLIGIIENVRRAVQRICMLISGFKGLITATYIFTEARGAYTETPEWA